MADLPSTNSKIQIEETTYRAPVSETLTQRIGSSINYALDQVGTNSAGLAAETAARIAADNTINGKLVARQSATGGTVMAFASNSVYADGTLIAEDSISIPTFSGIDEWIFLQIRADASNTTSPRLASYLDIDFLSDDDFGTQRAYRFTLSGGEHFGTVVRVLNYSNPLTVRVRQYASASIPGTGTRWTWDLGLRYSIVNCAAVFGS